jgi:succinate dehydrogenase/fumarate reductase flavoprotein subunit
MSQPLVVNTLADKITAGGGQIFFKNIGRQLVRGSDNASGRVTAVICEREDGSFARYNAGKAVVLATGDFSANREMMAKYAPQAVDMISDETYDGEPDYDREFLFTGLFTGDGQRMGLWIGAAWQKCFPNAPMGATINAGSTPNPYQNFWGLLVNRDGKRFMNEYCSNILGGRPQVMQPGGESYAIWDTDYSNLPNWYPGQGGYGILEKLEPAEIIELWETSVKNRAYVKADTIEDLISQLGLPAAETKASIERYNELCAAKEDKDFFKRAENLYPIAKAPFYGQKASGTPGMLTILGGLRTDDNMRVCDADDNPIEGLYNVGTMVGDFYSGYYTFQMEGINYGANCLTFGYLTGRFIADNE